MEEEVQLRAHEINKLETVIIQRAKELEELEDAVCDF